MIQALVNKMAATSWSYTMGGRINLRDKMVETPTTTSTESLGTVYYAMTYPYLLFKLESQFTKKTKIFTRTSFNPACGINVNSIDRWVYASWYYQTNPDAVEDLSAGKIKVGDKDFPLGFYNVTIYETDTNGELNPDNAKSVLYNGVVNMHPVTAIGASNFEESQYSEYTNNDSDTEAVYLTN
tara:strand:+ start:2312 stop:2860 length:549 start_codon:yes stop_codon:yes gene_type:complete